LQKIKILIQSLYVWGNFGILSINKEQFQIQGGTLLDRLQEFKTRENQKCNSNGPLCICKSPTKYLMEEIREMENEYKVLKKNKLKIEELEKLENDLKNLYSMPKKCLVCDKNKDLGLLLHCNKSLND
jgi:hypothetical protein